MNTVLVDFNRALGKIKPMHAVNNGPVYSVRGMSNFEDYKLVGIPYARNHDASFFANYGANHTVDVNFIFTNFDADPSDPASYDFTLTDEYIRRTELAGTKTYYRLGSRIEHEIKKYNTLPPKDFKKWAVICEHIIRHYTEGWADGFNYDIEYWEIWNEPDLGPANWGGTPEQFYELFNISVNHLKSCFPKLKIGGPAICFWQEEWLDNFFKSLVCKPDFFSWHCYGSTPSKVISYVYRYRELINKYGLTDAESILNEWNYVKGWKNEEFRYTVKSILGLKGAAYTSAVMLGCQNAPLDMLMYYDARPCAFNGLWAPYTYERLKGFYPFLAFNELYKLGTNAFVKSEAPNVFLAAAKGENEAAIIITHFVDDDTADGTEFELKLTGTEKYKTAEYYILDESHDLETVKAEECKSTEKITLANYATLMIKLK